MTSQGTYSIVVGGSWNKDFVQYRRKFEYAVLRTVHGAVKFCTDIDHSVCRFNRGVTSLLAPSPSGEREGPSSSAALQGPHPSVGERQIPGLGAGSRTKLTPRKPPATISAPMTRTDQAPPRTSEAQHQACRQQLSGHCKRSGCQSRRPEARCNQHDGLQRGGNLYESGLSERHSDKREPPTSAPRIY